MLVDEALIDAFPVGVTVGSTSDAVAFEAEAESDETVRDAAVHAGSVDAPPVVGALSVAPGVPDEETEIAFDAAPDEAGGAGEAADAEDAAPCTASAAPKPESLPMFWPLRKVEQNDCVGSDTSVRHFCSITPSDLA
jgi:hypothetical protein